MAGVSEGLKALFPLRSSDDVVSLFRHQLTNNSEPNIALLSIVLGALEVNLTDGRSVTGSTRHEADMGQENNSTLSGSDCSVALSDSKLPALQFSIVEALYEQYVTIVKGSVDLSSHRGRCTSLSLVKKVSDVIWDILPRTFYKEKAHLQTIFSLLSESKLDAFGMAISVIAACQILGLNDVHLALSEDHAWAVFGDPSDSSNAEITWHGKGSEDRRGQPVGVGTERSWFYTAPVICSRQMEVAAMVMAINTAINATTDSLDMAVIQQKLLWLLYDLGHLTKYPAALATLADMEEVSRTSNRPPPLTLYMKSIESASLYYDNLHVYPYTYLGNYHYRRSSFKQALHSWAQAAAVISRYNYNREDEEIYKEFLEIANEMIPNVMKSVSGDQAALSSDPMMVVSSFSTDVPLVSDPECYGFLLQFYDGLCSWEEGSSTPVLHITWATHALYSLNRFDMHARTNLLLKTAEQSLPFKESAAKQRNRRSSSLQVDTKTAADDASLSPKDVDAASEIEKLCIVLHSEKMTSMKDLLVADRLNSGAIKLQLTAQSQLLFKPNRSVPPAVTTPSNSDSLASVDRTRKRLRRE